MNKIMEVINEAIGYKNYAQHCVDYEINKTIIEIYVCAAIIAFLILSLTICLMYSYLIESAKNDERRLHYVNSNFRWTVVACIAIAISFGAIFDLRFSVPTFMEYKFIPEMFVLRSVEVPITKTADLSEVVKELVKQKSFADSCVNYEKAKDFCGIIMCGIVLVVWIAIGLLTHQNYKLTSTVQDPNVEKKIKAISGTWYTPAIIFVVVGPLVVILLVSFIVSLMKCNTFPEYFVEKYSSQCFRYLKVLMR